MAGVALLPRFETEPSDETVSRTKAVSIRDKDGKHVRFDYEQEEMVGGFMVYLPNGGGNSIFVDSKEELARLGLDRRPGLVDEESGEDVPEAFMSVKSRVTNKARNAR